MCCHDSSSPCRRVRNIERDNCLKFAVHFPWSIWETMRRVAVCWWPSSQHSSSCFQPRLDSSYFNSTLVAQFQDADCLKTETCHWKRFSLHRQSRGFCSPSGRHSSVLMGLIAMCYKPEGRGFETRWCHWIFSIFPILTASVTLGFTQPLI
jgi:hypothetical protein